MTGNFVKLRRGVLEHLRDGRLTTLEFAAYVTIILLADKSNGVWHGCAAALADAMGKVVSEESKRAAQRTLATLARKGYIKNFRVQGQRHNQPILVNKYLVTVGELKDRVIDAQNSTDWKAPAVFSGTENGTDDGTEVRTENGTDSDALSRAINSFKSSSRNTQHNIDQPASPSSDQASSIQAEDRFSDPVQKLTKLFLTKFLEIPIEKIPDKTWERNCKYARSLLAERDYDAVKKVLSWAKKEAFWVKAISEADVPFAMFAKVFPKIEDQMNEPKPEVKVEAKPKPEPKKESVNPEILKFIKRAKKA